MPVGVFDGRVERTLSLVERSPASTSTYGSCIGMLLYVSIERSPTALSSISTSRIGGVMSLSGTLASSSYAISWKETRISPRVSVGESNQIECHCGFGGNDLSMPSSGTLQLPTSWSPPTVSPASMSYTRSRICDEIGVGCGSCSSTRTVSYHCGLHVGSATRVCPA